MKNLLLLTALITISAFANNEARIADVPEDLPANANSQNLNDATIYSIPYFENGKLKGYKEVGKGPTGPIKRGTEIKLASAETSDPFGLQPSDVLLEIDGKKVNSLSDAQTLYANSNAKQIKVMRNGAETILTRK